MPFPVAARSKAWVFGHPIAGIAGSNPTGGTAVRCECDVLSGRGLCVGPITRPEESYRLWCVWVWSSSLNNTEALAQWGGWGVMREGRIFSPCKLVVLCLLVCSTVAFNAILFKRCLSSDQSHTWQILGFLNTNIPLKFRSKRDPHLLRVY